MAAAGDQARCGIGRRGRAPGHRGWVAGHWAAILGSAPTGPGRTSSTSAGKPHRRAARVAAAGALPRGDRRRRLRAPGPGRPRSQPRRDERSDRAAQRVGGARPAGDPGGPGGGDGGGARHRRPALAHVDRGRGCWWRGPWSRRPGCPTSAGGGCCSAGSLLINPIGRVVLAAARPGSCCAGSSRAAIRGGAGPPAPVARRAPGRRARRHEPVGRAAGPVYARLLGCRVGPTSTSTASRP